jgi:hypothetical protein
VSTKLAAALLTRVADQLAADAALIKAGAHNRRRAGRGTREVRERLDLAEAFVHAQMRVRDAVRDLHHTPHTPPTVEPTLFDVEAS